MTSFEAIIVRLLERVDLKPADQRTFYGRYRGFPLAVTLIGDADAPNLLIQLRHLLEKDQLPTEQAINHPHELKALLETGQAKIALEERIAWVSLYDVADLGDAQAVVDLLDSAIEGLQHAGVSPVGNLCHYCQRNEVVDLSYAEGRVAQICNNCLADRGAELEERAQASVLGISSTILTGGIACMIGAVLWAAGWTSYYAVLRWMSGNKERIVIPDILAFAIAAVIGALCGAPIGYLIGKIPQHGERVGISVAALAAIIAAIAGELLCWLVAVYRFLGVISLSGAWQLMGKYYWSGRSVMDVLDRIVGVAAAIFVAHLGAKYKRSAPSL